MKLELAIFPVNKLIWGDRTQYQEGVLSLNKGELLSLLREDSRIESAELEIVNPGDRARIVGIRDAVEPRIKASGPGCVFPGILGPIELAGQGVTNRLTQTAVIVAANFKTSAKAGTAAPSSSILDMWGAGAAVTPLGSTRNLVLALNLVEGISETDAQTSIQMAELRVADRLARTTLGQMPAQVEVFELRPTPPSLPRVVYILGMMTGNLPDISIYGMPVSETLPTLLHPNELFDGAITVDPRKGRHNHPRVWEWQNHPVVKELYRQHGKALHFLGVIFHRISANTHMGKEMGALSVAKMAKLLGAQGAVITRVNVSGNRFIDIMLAVQACEKVGIKTVLLTPEYGGKTGDELPFLFTVPEACSIVSTGSFERKLELDAPDLVIGPRQNGEVLMDPNPVQGRTAQPANVPVAVDGWDHIAGGVDWWGRGRLQAQDF
ncbi:MAG: hypothetical protein HY675_05590 [Chloroflexi bacterium]|nr:hypothetical protein [Chloroflexota bacterium]